MSEEIFSGVGRRKTAVARVYLSKGKGKIKVNNHALNEYFPQAVLKTVINKPFEITETQNKFDVKANLTGGGLHGQAGALSHGIARVLLKTDETFRPLLKKAGLLTRDSRMKERKKYGQKGARKRFQFSKR